METQAVDRPAQKAEVEHMKCFVAGEWIDSTNRLEVRNPYNNQVVGTVPVLTA